MLQDVSTAGPGEFAEFMNVVVQLDAPPCCQRVIDLLDWTRHIWENAGVTLVLPSFDGESAKEVDLEFIEVLVYAKQDK